MAEYCCKHWPFKAQELLWLYCYVMLFLSPAIILIIRFEPVSYKFIALTSVSGKINLTKMHFSSVSCLYLTPKLAPSLVDEVGELVLQLFVLLVGCFTCALDSFKLVYRTYDANLSVWVREESSTDHRWDSNPCPC